MGKRTSYINQLSNKCSETHGMCHSPEYIALRNAKSRCYYKKDVGYHNYGGRGIIVCDRWLNSFKLFLKDMGRRPSSSYSLDRIDSNKNYEPDNCKWSTRIEQNRNRRTSHYVQGFGKNQTLSAWSAVLKIHKATLRHKIVVQGLTIENIVGING